MTLFLAALSTRIHCASNSSSHPTKRQSCEEEGDTSTKRNPSLRHARARGIINSSFINTSVSFPNVPTRSLFINKRGTFDLTRSGIWQTGDTNLGRLCAYCSSLHESVCIYFRKNGTCFFMYWFLPHVVPTRWFLANNQNALDWKSARIKVTSNNRQVIPNKQP